MGLMHSDVSHCLYELGNRAAAGQLRCAREYDPRWRPGTLVYGLGLHEEGVCIYI